MTHALDTTHPGESGGEIPSSILCAIAIAAPVQRHFELACRLFADDTTEARGDDHVPGARLEHAIARALLDAWIHGQGSAETVGAAYALLADFMAGGSCSA
jgi:hypothetical protein